MSKEERKKNLRQKLCKQIREDVECLTELRLYDAVNRKWNRFYYADSVERIFREMMGLLE